MEEDFIDTCDVLQELCGLLSGYRYELHYHYQGRKQRAPYKRCVFIYIENKRV